MSRFLQEQIILLHKKAYALYAVASAVSSIGTGMQFLVDSWLALQLVGANYAVALVLIFSALPGIVLSPVIGLAVDRLDRKFLASGMDLFRGTVLLLVFLLWWFKLLQAWHIYLMTFLMATGDQVFFSSTRGLIREILPKELLLSANATTVTMIQLGMSLGAATGGLVIAIYSPGAVIVLNAISFLISGSCIINMRRGYVSPRVALVHSTGFQGLFDDLKAGVDYISQHTFLVRPYLALFSLTMTISVMNVLLAPFAKDVLHTGAAGFGYIDASFALGAVLGALFLPLFTRWVGEKPLMVLGVAATGGGLILFALAKTLIVAIIAYFLIGICFQVRILHSTNAQRNVDVDYQGRVATFFYTIFALITLVIYSIMGFLQEVLSQRYLYAFQGIFLFLVTLLIAKPLLISFRVAKAKQVQSQEAREMVEIEA